MLRERTKAGLDSARREGRIGGRRPKPSPQQESEIRKMVSKGHKNCRGCCPSFQNPPSHGLPPPRMVARLTPQEDQTRQIMLTELRQIIPLSVRFIQMGFCGGRTSHSSASSNVRNTPIDGPARSSERIASILAIPKKLKEVMVSCDDRRRANCCLLHLRL